MRNTRIYHIWVGVRKRCYNPKAKAYAEYGGRGITMCDRWRDSFEAFYYDMQYGYADHLTLEREDPNKGYDKQNCKWATYTEQARNKRNSVYVECDGYRRTIAEWADISGTNRATIGWRLRQGWPIHKAIYGHPTQDVSLISEYLVF